MVTSLDLLKKEFVVMRYSTKMQANKLMLSEETFSYPDKVGEVIQKHSFLEVEDLTPVDGFPLPEFTMWEASCECGEVFDAEGVYTVEDVDFLFSRHLFSEISGTCIASQRVAKKSTK